MRIDHFVPRIEVAFNALKQNGTFSIQEMAKLTGYAVSTLRHKEYLPRIRKSLGVEWNYDPDSFTFSIFPPPTASKPRVFFLKAFDSSHALRIVRRMERIVSKPISLVVMGTKYTAVVRVNQFEFEKILLEVRHAMGAA